VELDMPRPGPDGKPDPEAPAWTAYITQYPYTERGAGAGDSVEEALREAIDEVCEATPRAEEANTHVRWIHWEAAFSQIIAHAPFPTEEDITLALREHAERMSRVQEELTPALTRALAECGLRLATVRVEDNERHNPQLVVELLPDGVKFGARIRDDDEEDR
jgi:hypothetical protein